jgi:hypothetical protein
MLKYHFHEPARATQAGIALARALQQLLRTVAVLKPSQEGLNAM